MNVKSYFHNGNDKKQVRRMLIVLMLIQYSWKRSFFLFGGSEEVMKIFLSPKAVMTDKVWNHWIRVTQVIVLSHRASSLNCGRTPCGELDSPLPPVQERLAYLCPSRELLDFYREKVAQYDEEHEELLQTLESYRAVTDDQVSYTYKFIVV